MSQELANTKQLIPTQLGNILLERRLILEYDVEDYCRANAESQARLLQMNNVGASLKANGNWPSGTIPTAFQPEGSV